MNLNSPSPVQEDNLHRLLDQHRAAHADIHHHTRFPSLTEFSDSPSIYSHSHFSPRPPHLDSSPPRFDFAIPPQYAPRPSFDAVTSLASSTSNTHDLDTDCSSPTTDIRCERSPSPESIHLEDEEPEPRMSFLGPTMRFHSPAPWETEDCIKEGSEQEDDARSFVTKRSRSKTRGEGFMKGFGKSAPAKATSAVRPSMESTSGRDKVSLDGHISSSISHTQSQATGSSTPSSSRPSRPGLIFSRGRSRTVSHTATADTPIPPPPPLSPSSFVGSIHTSAASPAPTRSTSPDPSLYSSSMSPIDVMDASRPTSPQSLRGRSHFVHPYANPDLAYDAGPVHTTTSSYPSSSLGRRMFVPSDSIATVSESGVSQSSSTLTPDSSMSSVTDYHTDVLLKRVVGSVQGKIISNPLSTINGQNNGPKLGSQPVQEKGLALPNQGPGWTELTVSPTFNLISLQEAQAQARERSRTHTQVMPEAPFLQTEPPPRNIPTALPGNNGRLRSRTASAGSKTKAEPLVIGSPLPLGTHSNHEDATPIGQTGSLPRGLKHKKSGFMRLFNGKDKDKPPTPPPPSAPPVATPSIPRTPKFSSARVPVPSLSPSLVSQSPLQLDRIVNGDGGEDESVEGPQDRGSAKRQGAALSIVTRGTSLSPPHVPAGSQSARVGMGSASFISGLSPMSAMSSASAPPSTTTFPGLNLRPVSTVFSAHFADHIMTLDSSPTAHTDSSGTTVGGSSSLSSPSVHRSLDEKQAIDDDPYVTIQQLQEHMKSTRKAWQHQIWELEGQVRDLRAEIDGMRLKELRGERCILCGRSDGHHYDIDETSGSAGSRHGVVNRPRALTGVGARFGSAT